MPWDIQPDDYVLANYAEPDADLVYGSWLASEDALPHHIYLPLVMRDWP